MLHKTTTGFLVVEILIPPLGATVGPNLISKPLISVADETALGLDEVGNLDRLRICYILEVDREKFSLANRALRRCVSAKSLRTVFAGVCKDGA